MKKYTYIMTIVVVAILLGALVLFDFGTNTTDAPALINNGKINVGEVTYTTSSEQPKATILKLASFDSNEKEGTELTIYNQNFGLVKDIRSLYLENGLNLVEYKDVSSKIDPTSVLFKDLQYPSSFVVEQNYEYDLISKSKLLEKYLDKEITVTDIEGNDAKTYTGVLLSYSDSVVIQTSEGIVTLNPEKIVFPTLPENLRTKPTLVWKLYTESAGARMTETSYLTDGINWHAEYIAKINDTDDKMDFAGWVSIDNKSGTAYPNTSLKLVAGDVHRVTSQPKYAYDMVYANAETGYSPNQFGEESLFEYHIYTLDRTTDVLNNQIKQISLLSSENVPVKKIFYYDGASQGTNVQTKIEFRNGEEQGLGIPLPQGKVRVYKEDSQGKLQFVGEDSIDHTPKNEDTTLFLGNAFDLTGERTETENTNVSKGLYRTSYEINLRNAKDTPVEIVVHEYVGQSWTITKSSINYTKKNSSEVEFVVSVPANGETTLTYTIEHKYYW